MSMALLAQAYDETRRLAIAGSVVAPGDFRLKKLIGPLEQIGAKVPAFAKVAQQAKAVVEADDKTAATALLDLTTLICAILYTQGETGASGDLEPIETTDLGLVATQTSARVLKPLLEALSTTGSGRMEIIRDAFERGAFRDMRLLKPAAAAVDDVYPEIADFVAERILPLYGKAILPALRSGFDMNGKSGDARRLRLMHRLDPAGSRGLVKQALDAGSKEVKVAAVECLGQDRDDLSFLLEQANARAQDVRQAAYLALAGFDDDAAVAALQKAFDGKDLAVAADALSRSKSPNLRSHVLAGIRTAVAEVLAGKDKGEISAKANQVVTMLRCIQGWDDANAERLVLDTFGDRAKLAKAKGTTTSGADVNAAIVGLMAHGSPRVAAVLVEHHAECDAAEIHFCFEAARRTLPAAKVYEAFAPYLTAKSEDKKKSAAQSKRQAIVNELHQWRHGGYGWRGVQREELPPLDPRWLDAAVQVGDVALVERLIRPGNAAANRFLSEAFAKHMKSTAHPYECQTIVSAMGKARHPDAADAAIALIEKFNDKAYHYAYYWGQIIVELPKSALPRLEELLPKLNDRLADHLIGFLQQLRDKAE